MDKERVKRMTMENLPTSQNRLDLDTLASRVHEDVQHLNPAITMFEIFDAIRELNDQQDLFIFQNGTVSITTKGIRAWD